MYLQNLGVYEAVAMDTIIKENNIEIKQNKTNGLRDKIWGAGGGRVANIRVSEGTVRVRMRTRIMLMFWSLKDKIESRCERVVNPIKCCTKVVEAEDWKRALGFGILVTFFFKEQFRLSVKSRYQIAMSYWESRSRA